MKKFIRIFFCLLFFTVYASSASAAYQMVHRIVAFSEVSYGTRTGTSVKISGNFKSCGKSNVEPLENSTRNFVIEFWQDDVDATDTYYLVGWDTDDFWDLDNTEPLEQAGTWTRVTKKGKSTYYITPGGDAIGHQAPDAGLYATSGWSSIDSTLETLGNGYCPGTWGSSENGGMDLKEKIQVDANRMTAKFSIELKGFATVNGKLEKTKYTIKGKGIVFNI